jgi:hypothetical protein
MSSIIFEGNTYIFGATVSANPGTGVSSYVFGGLSSGSTFGFILRAFNSFGFSNFVGPALTKTLEQILETREAINLFSWTFPYEAISGLGTYISGSTVNIFVSSDDLSKTQFWSWGGGAAGSTLVYGISDPFGGTSAFRWRSSSAGGSNILENNESTSPVVVPQPGNTYIISFWLDASRGIPSVPGYGSGSVAVRYFGSSSFATVTQILPYIGTPGAEIQLAPSASGWVRYAFVFNPVTSALNVRLINGSAGSGTYRELYMYGPQLELA